MKKLVSFITLMSINAYCLAGSLSMAKPLPEGLQQGTFSLDATYGDKYFPGTSRDHSDGQVEYGNLGLEYALKSLNQAAAYDFTVNFNVVLHLYCKNNASAIYYFDDKQLKSSGNIVIQAPAGCGT
jgi:hypothetical protein